MVSMRKLRKKKRHSSGSPALRLRRRRAGYPEKLFVTKQLKLRFHPQYFPSLGQRGVSERSEDGVFLHHVERRYPVSLRCA